MEIKGELSNIKKSVVDEMIKCLDTAFGSEFVPMELAKILIHFTSLTGREIIVLVNRSGTVLETYIGEADSVKTAHYQTRNRKLRYIHTHPGYDSSLSEIDISFFRIKDVEAVIAISAGEKGLAEASFVYGRQDMPQELNRIPVQQANDMDIFTDIDDIKNSSGQDIQFLGGREKVILVGTDQVGLDELKNLAVTADAEICGMLHFKEIENKSRYYIGSGKIEELAAMVQKTNAESVIFDDELKGSQIRNIEGRIDVKVLDRTMLILDIFAKRAKSREGKLQVLLAQLKYKSTHLTGKGIELSRLGGGIGTSGPGETKLETDRRHIREQINNIEKELVKVKRTRGMHRGERNKRNLRTVALVGYTNSGKSSLLNTLTDSDVYVEDKLFATLDTTTRMLDLESGRHVLLSDTVGFINKLPHELIEAFKATLEEVEAADLLLIVLDSHDPNILTHQRVTFDILKEIGADKKPIVTLLNKMDLTGNGVDRRIYSFKEYKTRYIYVSALKMTGLDDIKKAVDDILFGEAETVTEMIPYANASRVSFIHDNYRVISETYDENDIKVEYEKM
jgi:GTPase